jgi:hypothetical protein
MKEAAVLVAITTAFRFGSGAYPTFLSLVTIVK